MDETRSRSPEDDDAGSVMDEAEGKKQINRACDFCHRMKMRCIGKENPPCRRCKAGGHSCTFDGPRKSKGSRVEDRLKFVESQMGSMQGALEELIRLQRAALPGLNHSPQHSQPHSSQAEQISPLPGTMAPQQSHAHTMMQQPYAQPRPPLVPQQSSMSRPTHNNSDYPTPNTLLHMESFLINPSTNFEQGEIARTIPSPSPSHPRHIPNVNWPMNGAGPSTMTLPPMATPQAQHIPPSSSAHQPPRPPSARPQSMSLMNPPSSTTPSHSQSHLQTLPTPPAPPHSAPPAATGAKPPSDPASEEEEDDTDPNTNNTMRDWDNMFYLAEAARLEADGHVVAGEAGPETKAGLGKRMRQDGRSEYVKRRRSEMPDQSPRTGSASDLPGGKPRKGSSIKLWQDPIGDVPGDDGEEDEDEFAEIKRNLPLQRGDLVHRFKDCVGMGFCDMDKARQMYNLFMDGCLVYMPCFDPEVDTFDSLRTRSPFLMTTLVMVGAKVTDAAGPVSDLQRQCREHAEAIGQTTLFSPVARIEVVQAMIVLASWGDTSWRPGGHALRMAMDMGLYRCLPLLVQAGMGKGKTREGLRQEWGLVVGTRVWLTLYKMEFEMAFNLGRPALFAGEETIRNAREFLKHPLSVRNDSRLVAACELLSGRAALHQPFAIIPNASSIPDLDEKLVKHDKVASEWFRYWNEYYAAQGIGPGSFLREALITGRCGAELFTNSRILHGVSSKADVARMPEHRRARLIKARHAAETLLEMCIRGNQYTQNFSFANLYTHLHVAFAARCLIRLVSLLPEGANTRQIGRDVEKVAEMLTGVPGFQYATFLKEVLKKARRKNVLPPGSRMASPVRGASDLPPVLGQGSAAGGDDAHAPLGTQGNNGGGASANANANANGGMGMPPLAGHQLFAETPPGGQNHVGGATSMFPDNASSSGFSFGVSPVEAHPFDFSYAEELFSQPRNGVPSQTFVDTSLTQSNPFGLDSWFPFPPLDQSGIGGMGQAGGGTHGLGHHNGENPLAGLFEQTQPGGGTWW